MNEYTARQDQIKAFLAERGLEALFLRRTSSFAWATCGASAYINTASTEGAASLLLTPQASYLITTNIEAPRFEKEEKLAEQGWVFKASPWYAGADPVADLAKGLKLGADGFYPGAVDLSDDISRLRTALGPEEGMRFKELGRLCAEAMDETIRHVHPGQTEYEIAGLLGVAAQKRGVQAIVNLIATDERIYNFRHPLPTGKKLDKYAMVVLCGRRYGLVCSLTRLVYFGQIPAELKQKIEAVARIDATFIHATQPGKTMGAVVQEALDAYAAAGFAEEWRLHHQGGPAGYEPREQIVTPGSADLVKAGQAYAWNPSITGCKSEDTILVGVKGNEVISEIPHWPLITVTLDGKKYVRPAVLEVE
jgi:Xaa-Pro aminopeptidase